MFLTDLGRCSRAQVAKPQLTVPYRDSPPCTELECYRRPSPGIGIRRAKSKDTLPLCPLSARLLHYSSCYYGNRSNGDILQERCLLGLRVSGEIQFIMVGEAGQRESPSLSGMFTWQLEGEAEHIVARKHCNLGKFEL